MTTLDVYGHVSQEDSAEPSAEMAGKLLRHVGLKRDLPKLKKGLCSQCVAPTYSGQLEQTEQMTDLLVSHRRSPNPRCYALRSF